MSAIVKSDDSSPCAGMQNITCRKTGVEKINGRQTTKWEFENTAQEGAGNMIFWLDEERKLPVRQVMPDGSGMNLVLIGKEKINGRAVEKWELTATRPGGKQMTTVQWYDPEIGMNIREERPDGSYRVMGNIRTGRQPAKLFTVPEGYSEVSSSRGGQH